MACNYFVLKACTHIFISIYIYMHAHMYVCAPRKDTQHFLYTPTYTHAHTHIYETSFLLYGMVHEIMVDRQFS